MWIDRTKARNRLNLLIELYPKSQYDVYNKAGLKYAQEKISLEIEVFFIP